MQVKTYLTIQGDTWDIIAKKIYGSEEYMTDLLKVNIEKMNIIKFSAGITIKIPIVEQKTLSDLLPPWKR